MHRCFKKTRGLGFGWGFFLTIGVTTSVMADPIDDVLNILNQLLGVQTQMKTDTGNISTATQGLLDQTNKEWAALTKSYQMADTQDDKNARLWSADDWQSVLKQASGGNNERLQSLMTSYSNLYPTIKNGPSGQINEEKLVATTYTQEGQTYKAALATSAYSYDDINNQIKKIEAVLAQVDDAGKNQNEKAAIDLNSRLVAELGFIQLQMLKLQSIHTQMDATKNQGELNNDTLDKAFTDYKLDEQP